MFFMVLWQFNLLSKSSVDKGDYNVIKFLVNPVIFNVSQDTRVVYLNGGTPATVPSSFTDSTSLEVTSGIGQPKGYVFDCVRAGLNFLINNNLASVEEVLPEGQTFFNPNGVTRTEKLTPTITDSEAMATLMKILDKVMIYLTNHEDKMLLKVQNQLTKLPLTMAPITSPVTELGVVELGDRVYWFIAASILLDGELSRESINLQI
jgi:hypothetical protein